MSLSTKYRIPCMINWETQKTCNKCNWQQSSISNRKNIEVTFDLSNSDISIINYPPYITVLILFPRKKNHERPQCYPPPSKRKINEKKHRIKHLHFPLTKTLQNLSAQWLLIVFTIIIPFNPNYQIYFETYISLLCPWSIKLIITQYIYIYIYCMIQM